MAGQGAPSAGYKFNTFQEIKSHSSILYNERMAILFYMLDMKSINMNTSYNVYSVLEVRSILKQIYKNIRMLLRNNPMVRATLNLETSDNGIYITDVTIGLIDRMIESCETRGYTTKKIYIIVQELNNFETMVKDVLQYFHYFIRPEFRQKPDVEMATEKYKEMADRRTVEELRAIVGKRHRIDFEGLGSSRVELQTPEVDDDVDDEADDEEDFDNFAEGGNELYSDDEIEIEEKD